MNNRSYVFWIATIVGIFVGIYLYFQHMAIKREPFVDAGSTKPADSSTGTVRTTVECPAGSYVENVAGIPYYNLLRIYLSSFSDRTIDGERAPYCMNQLRWVDLANPSIYFNVNSVAPPSTILGKGFPTKNVTLLGPSSDYLATDVVSYELKPFTIFFYASLTPPVFESDTSETTIFRIYAETPNSVRLIMKRSPIENRTRVQLILGKNQNRYTWDITTSTLVSNGNPCLYALTFDTSLNSNDKVATFYIGKSEYIANIIEFTQIIKLANSRIEINSSGSLDAIMYAFGFIDRKLTSTEIASLGEYMYKQHNEQVRELTTQCQETETKMASDMQSTVSDLTRQLAEKQSDKCETAEPEKEKDKRWNIRVPGSETAVATDTEVCSGLKIHDHLAPAPAKAPAPIKAPAPAPAPSSRNYHISYPEDMTNVDALPVAASPPPTVLQNTSGESKTYTPTPPTAPVQPSGAKIQSTSSSIEPPYLDEGESDPMALDASQGWMYSD